MTAGAGSVGYTCTATSALIALVVGGTAALTIAVTVLAVGSAANRSLPLAVVAGPLVVVTACIAIVPVFSRVTIAVERDRVAWSFGWGAFANSLPFSDLASAREADSRPFGLGYRVGPGVRYYWIGGTPGVELTARSSGLRYVLSCTDPQRLIDAIDRARGAAA